MTPMSVLVALARLALAIVWVVAALAKLRDRAGSRDAVEGFGVPAPLVIFITAVLPLAELSAALLLLLPGRAARVGAIGSLLMLVAFSGAVIVNLLLGRRPDCHCFGDLGRSGGISWLTVVRNLPLIVLAAVSFGQAGSQDSMSSALGTLSTMQVWVLVGAILAAAALVVMGLTVRTLMGRYGAVLMRLEALERATGLAGPPVVPDFSLPNLKGQTVGLTDVLAKGRPALLVFTSLSCTHCAELMPDLAAWQADRDHPLSVLVLSDGSIEQNQAKWAGIGPLNVLLRDEVTTMGAYEVRGTPAAVLIDQGRRRLSEPAHGVKEVRSLHAAMLQSLNGESDGAHEHVHEGQEPEIQPGAEVPDVLLLDEQDLATSPSEAIGEEAILLFWRYDCGFCQRIVQEVHDLEESTALRIVSTSDLGALRASGLTSPVLRDPDGALERWLGVPGTPSAARIRHGRLDSQVVVGGPGVLEMLRASERSSVALD